MVYNEDETANILAKKLEKELEEEYIVKCKYNICYMAKILGYNEKGIPVFEEADGKKYKYQTDICIFKNQKDLLIPIIIIETKLGTYTTHDVITYCNKASDHKRFHMVLLLWIRKKNVFNNVVFLHIMTVLILPQWSMLQKKPAVMAFK